MLKILEEEQAIKKYQRQFLKNFKPYIEGKIPVRVGHMGASFEAKVSWSSRLGIWLYSAKIADSRYWNAFGIGRPEKSSAISITCEINLPIKGIDRRIGGALAKDSRGPIFLVHRGKIGGGKKGIGKSLFENHYRGVWTMVEDGDQETSAVLIGAFNSPRFVRQVIQFIHKIERIKALAHLPSPQLEIFHEPLLREEFIGEKQDDFARDMEAECDQGLVITDLAAHLSNRKLRVANDDCRDLFLLNKSGEIEAVFQVINDMSETLLHRGAMRLLLNTPSISGHPRLILIIPQKPDRDLEEKFKKLHIEFLVYEWKADSAVFPDIDKLLFTN